MEAAMAWWSGHEAMAEPCGDAAALGAPLCERESSGEGESESVSAE